MGQHHSTPIPPPPVVDLFGSCAINIFDFALPRDTCSDTSGVSVTCPAVVAYHANGIPGAGYITLPGVKSSVCSTFGGNFTVSK